MEYMEDMNNMNMEYMEDMHNMNMEYMEDMHNMNMEDMEDMHNMNMEDMNNFNNVENWNCCRRCPCNPCGRRQQRHVHEVLGSVEIAGYGKDAHNHRFATVSGEAILIGKGDHVHEIRFRTDFYDDHYHEFQGRSGGAIDVGGGRHVHFAEAKTTTDARHFHCFRVAALIENPIGD